MIKKLKKTISSFTRSEKDVPLLAGLISGFYPFIYYFSENFPAKNSLEHLLFFSLFFIGIAIVVFITANFLFNKVPVLKPYKKHMYFVLILMLIATGLSQAIYLTVKKKFLTIMLLAVSTISLKLYKDYKKLIVIVVLMCIVPLSNTLISLYDSLKPLSWMQQPDDIETVILKQKPNIYFIQPDGYVSEQIMKDSLHGYKNTFYSWLRANEFKLYDDFRSNYPNTLLSNSSLFGMKQHQFGDVVIPKTEMLNSRDIISGNNPVISILKNNGYTNFLIAHDEYFQNNNCEQFYDYTNIKLEEIPYFSHGSHVRPNLLDNFNEFIKLEVDTPKFFFIEKLQPLHVMLINGNINIEKERQAYFERIEEANTWLKEVVNTININDKNSIIIILSDHGGMVGIKDIKSKFMNDSEIRLQSVFSNIAAIKWNGFLKENYDKDLKTNVNLFRVLFSALSENPKYLKHLEDNSSYNLNYENPYYNSVHQAINDKGEFNLK